MDERVEHTLALFRRMVSADGGVIELVSVEGGTARIRYTPGRNEECPDCVLSPEDLEIMLRTSFEAHAPHIQEIELV